MALKKTIPEPSWETKYSFSPASSRKAAKVVAARFCIAAERKPLELIAQPLSVVDYTPRRPKGGVGCLRISRIDQPVRS